MTIDINEFIKKLESEFEEVEPGTLSPATSFHELRNWDSMHALMLIAFITIEYDVNISADDLAEISTIQDIFNIVVKRIES